MVFYLTDYTYTNNRLALVFYDDERNKFRLWQSSRPDHLSYAYIFNELNQGDEFIEKYIEDDDFLRDNVGYETTEMYHPLWHQKAQFMKVYFTNPNHIRKYMKDADYYENHVKYYARYAIDKKIAFGMPYNIIDDKIIPLKSKPKKQHARLAKKLVKMGFDKTMVRVIITMLVTPVPSMSYMTLDIECLSRGNVVPDPFLATEPVISIAFKFSTGEGLVLCLDHETRAVIKRKVNPNTIKSIKTGEYKVEWFKDERDLFKRLAEVLADPKYRMIVTYNGDNFDLQYLCYRSRQLNVWLPLKHSKSTSIGGRDYHSVHYVPKNPINRNPDMVTWKLHLDLYRFLSQPYVKDYAFKGVYKDNRLGTIGEALVNMSKIEHDEPIGDMSIHDLIHYNYRDVIILDQLMKMNNGVLMALIFLLMRLGVEPLSECHRKAISSKIGHLVQNWVTRKKWITPRRQDFRGVEEIAYKRLEEMGVPFRQITHKYKGATVIDPKPGNYFNSECRDFTGLYTNTIYSKNISFETINCGHPACQHNLVPEVKHYVCTKEKGLMSQLIGIITTARGLYFKPEAINDPFYSPIEQVLKVFGNASYGVFGARFFDYYLRIQAETTTAYARDALDRLIKKAKELGMLVIYGDTDSLFLTEFSKESMQELVEWTDEELELELNLDYDLQFYTVSKRKKNYLGIRYDGTPVVTGFKIKKRNTPKLIVEAGNEVIKILSTLKNESQLKMARARIILLLRQYYTKIWKKEGDVTDYAFMLQITKKLKEYKVLTIHVRAALMEAEALISELPEGVSATPEDIIVPGTLQSYIKCDLESTRSPSGRRYRIGVLPLSMAEKKFISPAQYHKELISSMNQIVEMLDIEADDYMTRDPQRPALDKYFKKVTA